MRLAFSIAIRFLKSGKGQTLLITLGISVGVAVQIFIGSLIQGLQLSLVDTTIGSSPHITIIPTNTDKTIKMWERAVYEAEINDDGIVNVSAAADGSSTFYDDYDTWPVLVRGFELDRADRIYKFRSAIYAGSMPWKKDQAIMGKDLAVASGTLINDEIMLVSPQGAQSRLQITGFYDLKSSAVNESWIVTTLETSQGILALDNGVTSVEMQVVNVFSADELADRLAYNLSLRDVKVENWKDQNQSLLSGLKGQSISSYMIQVFVLVAVLLGISSVLAISVVQRSRQLGILKAMGINDRDASLIFVFQGLLLGFAGALAGIVLGFGLLFFFTKFAVNPDGSPVVEVYISSGFIALSGFFAVISAVVASLIPANLSSRLNPIEVIKNG